MLDLNITEHLVVVFDIVYFDGSVRSYEFIVGRGGRDARGGGI